MRIPGSMLFLSLILVSALGAQDGGGDVLVSGPDQALEVQWGLAVQTQATATDTNGVEAYSQYYLPGLYWSATWDSHHQVQAGMEVFLDEYIYIGQTGMAHPTQRETGSEVGNLARVLGLVPGASYTYLFTPGPGTTWGFGPQLDLALRLPIQGLDNTDDTGPVTGYLLGKGRFLYPGLHAQALFTTPKGIVVGPYVKAQIPIYRLWDGDSLPLTDGMVISIGLRIRLKL